MSAKKQTEATPEFKPRSEYYPKVDLVEVTEEQIETYTPPNQVRPMTRLRVAKHARIPRAQAEAEGIPYQEVPG